MHNYYWTGEPKGYSVRLKRRKVDTEATQKQKGLQYIIKEDSLDSAHGLTDNED